MTLENLKVHNIHKLSVCEDPLLIIINSYLQRAIQVKKDFLALNREIEEMLEENNEYLDNKQVD